MNWLHTLTFKIVALAVLTGLLSTVTTTELMLRTGRSAIERLLLERSVDEQQATAALISSKIEILQAALTSISRRAPAQAWQDPSALTQYLQQNGAATGLFDSVFAANTQGQVVVRLVGNMPRPELPAIGDRPFFQQAMRGDQLVTSVPIVSRVDGSAIVVLAMASRDRDGRALGVVAGLLALRSSRMFAEIGGTVPRDDSRTLIMNRSGTVLAHTQAQRVMGHANDEAGLAEVYQRWHDAGSPIDTDGSATLSGDYLVSMAGIPFSDWTLVRITPKSVALTPLQAARRTAWLSAGAVGLATALLAIGAGLLLTRPIHRLRAHADRLLAGQRPIGTVWSEKKGELGALARTLQQLDDHRARRQQETQALLQQLEAVFDHAQVGIALTRNSRFVLVSQHFCDAFGMRKSEMEGQATRIIYPSDAAYADLAARARPHFMGQGFFAGEVELVRKSGQIFWAHMRGRAVAAGDLAQGTIWTIDDVTEQREQRKQLTWSASHDALTGLLNRAAFEAVLAAVTAKAAGAAADGMPGSSAYCAMFIDLDHFKQVNDSAGHAAGDAVLRDVASILQSKVRQRDALARLGGDEFAVILRECPLQQGRGIAQDILAQVMAYRLDWQGTPLSVGASIGIVLAHESLDTPAAVMAAADRACYAAKHAGRNCIRVYEEQSATVWPDPHETAPGRSHAFSHRPGGAGQGRTGGDH